MSGLHDTRREADAGRDPAYWRTPLGSDPWIEAVTAWSWVSLAVRGVAALAFGLVTLIWPGPTLDVLVLLWGAYTLVDGVSLLAAVVSGAPGTRAHRPLLIVEGIAGVAAGIVTFAWPGITALVLLYLIAAWAAVIGVVEIGGAVHHRPEIRHHWLLVLNGALLLAFAIVLVAAPVAGALAITWLIGWWALVFGVVLLGAARWVRRAPVPIDRPVGRARHGAD